MSSPDLKAFNDTVHIPEEFLDVLDQARSEKEKDLQSILWFHIGVLNGGLFTTLENHNKKRTGAAINAFKRVGIEPVATIIQIAFEVHTNYFISKKSRKEKIASLTDVYVSMTYDLPYGSSGGRGNEEFSSEQESDWIARLCLQFARNNIEDLPQLVKALNPKGS